MALMVRRVLLHVLTVGAVALGCVPSLAAAAPGPLTSDGNGQCVDVEGGGSAPLTPVITWPCHGGANQGWELTAAGELRTFGGTVCLDAMGAATAVGTPLISYPCNGGANQQWRYGTDRTLVGVGSGRCVEITGATNAPGAKLQLAACSGSAYQHWSKPSPSGNDTTAPTPPGSPKLSALTCNFATLSWTAATDAVGVTAYDVYHDGQLMKSVDGGTLTTALTLTPGAKWGFYVNARDAAGNVSQASPTLAATIPQCSVDTQPPTAPTGFTGSVSGTTVTLRWTASTDNVGVTAYDLYRGDAKIGSTAGSTTKYIDSGLQPRTPYTYSVAARDAQGNASTRGPKTSLPITTGAACKTAVCQVTQVGTDTDIPWGLVALPDGTAIYSRRDADDIVRLDLATGARTSLGAVPGVEGTDGEGGLLGIAVTSGFPTTDPWLYIHHTSPTDNRIVRIKVVGWKLDLSTEQVLLSGIPRNKYHNGGRLRFGPDGKLYASTGDAQNGANAQDLGNLGGKILRLNPDGSKPSDNPYGSYVWSYGHRNPQGLAFDAQGRLWEQEFGNSTLDETNLIVKGGNYGWPDCEATVSQSGGGCATPGYVAPKYTYPVADGSCSGIAIVGSALFVACERGTRLYRHVISGDALTGTTELFAGTYGRLRTVEPTPDGSLLLTTSNLGDKDSVANNSDEKIFKVVLGS